MEQNQAEDSGFPSIGFASVAIRVLAVLGFVAILGIGMWGSIKVAQGVPNAFSSLASAFVGLTSVFVPVGEAITLSAPSPVASGVPFTLSWTHDKKSADGSYTFRYDCADGVYFTSPSAAGTQTTVYCNVPFNFLNSNNSISLIPVSTKHDHAAVTVYIDFTPNGVSRATVTGKAAVTIQGTSTLGTGTSVPVGNSITIIQPAPTTHPVTPGPAQTQTFPITGVSPQASNPNGYVDLAARVIDVGLVDKTTGVFTASSTPTRNSDQSRVAVHFAIENNGTKTSPQFDFSAVLPTMPSYIFSSPMQQELAPGDRIEFTLAFDDFNASGTGVFTVNVDPSGRINEKNKDNNIIHYTITTSP